MVETDVLAQNSVYAELLSKPAIERTAALKLLTETATASEISWVHDISSLRRMNLLYRQPHLTHLQQQPHLTHLML